MKLTTLMTACFVLGGLGSAHAVSTNTFLFFGDSALEQGNYQLITGQPKDDFAPYYCGLDGLCRDSNGPVWVEYLGIDVKAALSNPAEYDGLNFAVSGAEMGQNGDTDLPLPTGVTSQIDIWKQAVAAGAIEQDAKDVFVIQAGGNDVLNGLSAGADAADIANRIVSDTLLNLKTLLDEGAHSIVLWEVETVDYAGYFRTPQLAEFRGEIAHLVDDINAGLRQGVDQISKAYGDGVTITTIPHRPFVEFLEANADALGFTNGTNFCFDMLDGDLCSSAPDIQNSYILFDQEHLSTAAQRIEAAWFQAHVARDLGITFSDSWKDYNFNITLAPIPLPAPFFALMAGLAGLGFVGRSRKTGSR